MKNVSIKTNKKERQKNTLEEADKVYIFFLIFKLQISENHLEIVQKKKDKE